MLLTMIVRATRTGIIIVQGFEQEFCYITSKSITKQEPVPQQNPMQETSSQASNGGYIVQPHYRTLIVVDC